MKPHPRPNRSIKTITVMLESLIIVANVRSEYSEAELQSMADNLARIGLINPITVIAHPTEPGRFIVLAGKRRVLAAQKLGWPTIEAIVIEARDDADQLAISISENTQRVSMSPLDIADAVSRLAELRGITAKEAAAWIGVSPSIVSRSQKADVLLTEGTKQLLAEEKAGMSAYFLIAEVPETEQLDLASRYLDERWTRDQLQQEVRRIKNRDQEVAKTVNVRIVFRPDDNYDVVLSQLTNLVARVKRYAKQGISLELLPKLLTK
jgi:ParB family chromosome partitioning protein